MLCLSRKTHQTILIGDDIRITVIRVSRLGGQTQVTLGIDAPRGMTILRAELLARAAVPEASQN